MTTYPKFPGREATFVHNDETVRFQPTRIESKTYDSVPSAFYGDNLTNGIIDKAEESLFTHGYEVILEILDPTGCIVIENDLWRVEYE